MASGQVDLSSLPPEEIFKLLESNNQEVSSPPIVHKINALLLEFTYPGGV